jgi:hypothetical protein
MITLAYIVYFLGCLSLMAFAALTLRSMPVGVYVSTWEQHLPRLQLCYSGMRDEIHGLYFIDMYFHAKRNAKEDWRLTC